MTQNYEQVHEAVRERYGRLAVEAGDAGCCGSSSGSDCCGSSSADVSLTDVTLAGTTLDSFYSDLYQADTSWLPQEVTGLSLGCGDPITAAGLQPGQTVLDLGSGGGIDAFMAARRVGPAGRVIGVDMTPEMLEKAARNKIKVGLDNVEFRHGYIEALPVEDNTVDVILSNCVINLSPDKDAVLRESFRVLRPGGRFAVSDIVLLREIPDELRGVLALWTGCISGSLHRDEYVEKLTAAGFTDAGVEVTRTYSRADLEELADQLDAGQVPGGITEAIDALDGAFASAFIRARKP